MTSPNNMVFFQQILNLHSGITMYEAFFFFIWFLAGFITGVSGLGAAMVAVPLLSLFIDLHTIIPVSNCLVVVLCLEIGYIYRKGILKKELSGMLIGSLPGLVLGTYILMIIPAPVLLLSIGIVMAGFVLWQFLHKIPAESGNPSSMKAMFAGFVSGILTTSITFSGPPCAVYALHARWTQKQTLATLNTFAALSSILGVITYVFTDLLTRELLFWIVLGTPAVTLGILLSIPVNRYINVSLFRMILLVVIGFGGLSCIVKSFFIMAE